MPIASGKSLLHYRLIEKIGEGGMGVVWLANDTTLGREVAIKVLPEGFARDPERMARFEREAKVLASLNHPNIAHLYGLETATLSGAGTGSEAGTERAADTVFLTMELVEGEDLSERLRRGPIPVEEAIPLAQQIAAALEAAHERGIVHRDLKPANIKLRPDGAVKVLDFGLAKSWETADGDASLSMSPTITRHSGVDGMILGTAAYMAPEQARGQEVDRRADIWSFGVVLWEMLTGRRLFGGETVSDVLASVLKETPDLGALPADTPPALRRLLGRCLTRDARSRLQWVGDARLELADAVDEPSSPPAAPGTAAKSSKRGREVAAWIVAVAAVAAMVFLWWRPVEQPVPPVTRFAVPLGSGRTLSFGELPSVALSPDGRTLAFVATDLELDRDMIYLRRLSETATWPLAGTEGGSEPFFAPDGRHLGFFADGKLKKISLDGGTALELAAAPNPRGGVWLEDDTILFSPEYASGLWSVAAGGGTPEVFVDLDPDRGERTFRFPDELPGRGVILFTVGSSDSPNNYDEAQLVAYSLASGERKVLVDGANMGRFAGSDKLVYTVGGVLYEVSLDIGRLETVGEARPVNEDVGGDSSSGAGYYDVAADGTLAWVAGSVNGRDSHLSVVDRDGTATRLPLEPRGFHQPRFSPDGTRLAFTVGMVQSGVDGSVWIYSLSSGALNRLTFSDNQVYPAWSPDGRRVAYLAMVNDSVIRVKAADGSGRDETIMGGVEAPVYPESFSVDGSILAFTRIGQTPDLYLVRAGEKPQLFEADACCAAFSPDGRWIAYQSPGSGTTSVFVRSLEGEGKWQVSPGRGGYPRWSGDGRRLFYIDASLVKRPLMEVEVEAGDTFRTGPPRTVIEELKGRFATTTSPASNWDVAPDGDHFVFVEPVREEDAGARIEIATHWSQHLQ